MFDKRNSILVVLPPVGGEGVTRMWVTKDTAKDLGLKQGKFVPDDVRTELLVNRTQEVHYQLADEGAE